jgi:ketosteroid isomerase-like protein
MKAKLFSLIGLVIITMIACAPKDTKTDDLTLVNSLATMSADAFNSNDVNRTLGLFTNDAVFLNGQVKISGADSLRKSFTNMFQHSSNFKYYPGLSSVNENIVFIEGLFTFDWNMNGAVSQAKGVMREVFIKQPDNSWKITYSEENHGDIRK